MKLIISNEADIDGAAREFLEALGSKRHVAFHAPMGAGKTTFISALCRCLGTDDEVNSPTFSIINEYRGADGRKIFHFDFYRMENEAQCAELGLEEYFDSEELCLMEWPENAETFLPDDTLHVSIEVREDGSRQITFEQ